MGVDLSDGTAGIMQFEGSHQFYCMSVERVDDDAYSVRLESGWYEMFTRQGKRLGERGVRGDIISFIPIGTDDPRAARLPTEITP